MLPVNPVFAFEGNYSKRRPILVLLLALVVVGTLLSTGCSTLFQTSTSAGSHAAQQIIVRTNLPGAGVGRNYLQVLSITGGQAPYSFFVSQGELPPGLVLNAQTGSISGTPTRSGDYTFTISVSGAPSGSFGSRTYTLTVQACSNCVTVQISPTNTSVTAGGKIQFTAAVGNTSNTAVIWSASAGTISANGLFTAPASGSKSITVTGTSSAEASAHSSTSVAINSVTTFAITTTSVPSAVKSASYTATLDASGGQPPYGWSIASGSLPPGLQLGASSGVLSGSATQDGTFAFTVLGKDSASHTAQKSLSLVVSGGGVSCGPPAYGCSRSDLNIVQLPKAPPSVGNLSGANTIVTDPNFGNRIVRITDAQTNPGATFVNRTYVTASSGSADDNLWNIDSTLFIVQDTGSQGFPFTFNPSTMQAARMYVSSFPATKGFTVDSGNWSRVNPNILYTYSGTVINKYDFTDRINPPSPQPVYDFASNRNCLPAGFTATWSTKGGVSGDDTVFAMAYSNTGIQGSAIYAVVYKVGSGCSFLNTATGQVGGDWGTKGTVNVGDRWTIHNVKLSKDGNWLILSTTTCTSHSCAMGPYFWQIGTTNVTSCGDGGMCGGHFTEGYSHWVNNDNSPLSNQVIRTFADAKQPTALTSHFPVGIITPFDQHQSWNNADPADSVPFLSSTWSPVSPFPAPWYNEIIAVAADGSGKTTRFAHTFITTNSQRFATAYAIGNVSQDGKFFMFSSDWMGTLGSESGTRTCTIGTNCRGDVFIVELR